METLLAAALPSMALQHLQVPEPSDVLVSSKLKNGQLSSLLATAAHSAAFAKESAVLPSESDILAAAHWC